MTADERMRYFFSFRIKTERILLKKPDGCNTTIFIPILLTEAVVKIYMEKYRYPKTISKTASAQTMTIAGRKQDRKIRTPAVIIQMPSILQFRFIVFFLS